ncbi:LytTR family DNA-binding domain-containing protein, partial [Chitinophaga sp.]|uniref:LytR/AlgR family response regulator transcription factor n=1 Tax=Chitinophaga sp. TaxID=1869181 RepID=UPI002625FBC2
ALALQARGDVAFESPAGRLVVVRAARLEKIRNILGESDQVFVKDGDRCWFVKLQEIRLFESVGNYARVYFETNKPLILKSLNALEERLDERVFFRANRKHIVNLRMIERIDTYFNGGLLLEMRGGEKIEVSRRQAVKFKEMMSL